MLVFDQFEEFFINTRSRPAMRREFIQLVASLVHHPARDVRLTFSLREDYLAELDEFRDAFPDMLANQHRLLPLTAFGARQAIVAPLWPPTFRSISSCVVRLVDLLAEVDFDPVLLQIACGEVYREAIKREGGAGLRLTEAGSRSRRRHPGPVRALSGQCDRPRTAGQLLLAAPSSTR